MKRQQCLFQNVSALVGKTAFLTCVVRNLKPTQRVSISNNDHDDWNQRFWWTHVPQNHHQHKYFLKKIEERRELVKYRVNSQSQKCGPGLSSRSGVGKQYSNFLKIMQFKLLWKGIICLKKSSEVTLIKKWCELNASLGSIKLTLLNCSS